jgi:hypothetical protein
VRVLVAHHDWCFDGVASAALFTRLHSHLEGGGHSYSYLGLSHGPEKAWSEGMLTGETNAAVDFRYLASPKLDWWFDHHRTAFELPGDEEHFRADRSGRKFFDPDSKSCARLIGEIGRSRFGIDWGFHEALIEVANVNDGALWATAEEAADFEGPAGRIRMVLEGSRERSDLERILRSFIEAPWDEAARIPEISRLADRLATKEEEARRIVRESGRPMGPNGEVVVLDVVGKIGEGFSKFFSYAEFPEALYILTIVASKSRTKIGLGFNPWTDRPRLHDVSAICRRFGGGGHPVVGAMAFPPGPEGERQAREVAAIVVSELLAPPAGI